MKPTSSVQKLFDGGRNERKIINLFKMHKIYFLILSGWKENPNFYWLLQFESRALFQCDHFFFFHCCSNTCLPRTPSVSGMCLLVKMHSRENVSWMRAGLASQTDPHVIRFCRQYMFNRCFAVVVVREYNEWLETMQKNQTQKRERKIYLTNNEKTCQNISIM